MAGKLKQAQNFITNPHVAERLLDAAKVGPDDLVLEIGPGEGAITELLSQRARRVVAVELDAGLAMALKARFARTSNVQVEQADILAHPLPRDRYTAVGNIPFDQTADIIRRLFDSPQYPPSKAGLIMQSEAADKFSGHPQKTLAAVLLANEYQVKKEEIVDKHNFKPVPKVDAAIVSFYRRAEPLVAEENQRKFYDLVTYGYTHGQKGKSAIEVLTKIFSHRQRQVMEKEIKGLKGAQITGLSPQQWVEVFAVFQKYVPDEKHAIVAGAGEKLREEQKKLPKVHRTRKY